jgi:AraC-like DNA-binding protein
LLTYLSFLWGLFMENTKIFNSFVTRENPIDISIVGETFCDENYYIERECSDLMALEYIVSGSGTLEINGQTLCPKANSVVLLTEGSRHRYFSDKNDLWHKYWIIFNGNVAHCLIDEFLPKDTYLFENLNLEKEFAQIYSIAMKNDYDYQQLLVEVSKILFNIILAMHNSDAHLRKGRAELIRDSLDEMVEGEYSLDQLAEKMNYSKNYIISIFKKKYGKTPYKYYMDAKIETAKLYLLHSDDTITEISNRLCYIDPQYFATCFKKTTGLSPRQFRNSNIR